ncbi:MAG: RNA 2',3'-cyclic phosphodiesterase [Thaumarchaeota archaeon]|nr:RNA 2',3'-cyclic phosphodiesterase [Nitrososphaerota archaeon]
MMRVFVAVDISDHITDVISEFQASSGIGGKPVRPHNMHFTLQFLGDIHDNSKRVIAAFSGMAFSKFDIKLQGLGTFPEKGSPRIVWVGTDSAGGQKLCELSEMVRHTLAPLGYSNSTAFKPHVTIFRLKPRDTVSRLAEFAETSFGMQQVLTIKLKQSILNKDGPTYTDLAEVAA